MFNDEVHVVGIQRSGIHAIINWIIGHYNTAVFKNDAGVGIHEGIYSPVLYKDGKETGKLNCFADEQTQLVIFGHENASVKHVSDIFSNPAYLSSVDLYAKRSESKSLARRRLVVLNLRDPFNTFASLCNLLSDSVRIRELSVVWTGYAKEILGETSYFGPKKSAHALFNKWCSSKSYREELSVLLGLSHNDQNFRSMMPYGGGSSFDGMSYQNRADQMNLKSRWEKKKDNPGYIKIFNENPDLVKYSKRIFDFVPEPFKDLL